MTFLKQYKVSYRTKDGSYLENSQLEPDFKVANAPEDVVAGKDAQIETAVKEYYSDSNSSTAPETSETSKTAETSETSKAAEASETSKTNEASETSKTAA